MRFGIKCPACSKGLSVDALNIGAQFNCPHCNRLLAIPKALLAIPKAGSEVPCIADRVELIIDRGKIWRMQRSFLHLLYWFLLPPIGWIVIIRILLFDKSRIMAESVFIDGNELEINVVGTQKRIPIKMITDLTITRGRIMRRHGISKLIIMTSGAAAAGGIFMGTDENIKEASALISRKM